MKSMAAVLLLIVAERERLGLPVRKCPCTCGNSGKGLACTSVCRGLSTNIDRQARRRR